MTAAAKVRVGIIGPGKVAREHLAPALVASRNCCVWSVLGNRESATRDFATAFSANSSRPYFTDLDAFLADPMLEGVIVATADSAHAAIALKCIGRGIRSEEHTSELQSLRHL